MHDGSPHAEHADPATARFREFLIARGGPFDELQMRLGLLRANARLAARRAAVYVGLAWGVPLVLCVISGSAWGPVEQHPYLLSFGAWARFFVAIALFVLMERMVEERLRATLGQFVRGGLIAPSSVVPGAEAVVRALRRLHSRSMDLVCLALAALVTVVNLHLKESAGQSTWLIHLDSGGAALTAAGWWCVAFSSPLFWFLALRWLCRHGVWALLLRDLSRLELRLVATHPDGCGGLAFVGRYPNAFTAFVLALSAVMGAELATRLMDSELAPTLVSQVAGLWLAVMLGLFAVPLAFFGRPLKRLKEDTLSACAAAATRRERARERELLGRNAMAGADADDAAADELPDVVKTYQAAQKLSTTLFSRAALLPISAAAVLPLVAAAATRLPFKELLSLARGLILL